MRLVVLMAGDSGVFEVAGHKYPKNLVEIDGEPLVQRVIDGLQPLIERASHAVFLVREEENRRHHTDDVIRLLAPEAEVIGVPVLASGAACTALHAICHIDRDEPLVIFNGDQVLEADLGEITGGLRVRRARRRRDHVRRRPPALVLRPHRRRRARARGRREAADQPPGHGRHLLVPRAAATSSTARWR